MRKLRALLAATVFAFPAGAYAQAISGGTSGGASNVTVNAPLPPLVTGTSQIGTVGLVAGTSQIGTVGLVAPLPPLSAGTAAIGTVGVTTLSPLVAGAAQVGHVALPIGTGAAPSGAATITTASTYQVLFAAASVVNGCYITNPSTTATLYVDWTGATGTTLAPTSQPILPGGSAQCAFTPTNAITVFGATAGAAIIAGRF